MTSSGLQDVAANANPFMANEDVTRHFAMWLTTNVSKGIRKPLPMTNAEVRALACNVALESVEMLQALIVSLIKALSGTRNPHFSSWQWERVVLTGCTAVGRQGSTVVRTPCCSVW